MKVSEFMTKKIVTLRPENTLQEAAQLMLEKNIGIIPIVDSEFHLLGSISESDFAGKKVEVPHALGSVKKLLGHIFISENIENIFSEAKKISLAKVMSKSPKCISSDYTLTDVVNLMIKDNATRLLVVEEKKLVGLVTRQDIMKAFLATKEMSGGQSFPI